MYFATQILFFFKSEKGKDIMSKVKAKIEVETPVVTAKKKIVDRSTSRSQLSLKMAFARCKRING